MSKTERLLLEQNDRRNKVMQWFDKVLLIGISILLLGGITTWIGTQKRRW